jgi:prepilin-type N-terminal cleavage/methylation domain-containing protein
MRKTAQMYGFTTKQTSKGFTLVELLVVIAIIAVLAAVVVLIINPLELTRRSRDASRLSDLANLQTAINVAAQEATNSGVEILCVGGLSSGFCEGRSNVDSRSSNGTGWVKVDLSTQNSVSVPTLPADPKNDNDYHYTYCSDGSAWEINAKLESQQQIAKMENDGGPNLADNSIATPPNPPTGLYESGSN